MNPSFILNWALMWTTLGSVVLLVTAWFVRRLQYAPVRHLAWVIAFACVAITPVLLMAGSEIPKNKAAVETQACASKGDDTKPGDACNSTLASDFSSRPLAALAVCAWVSGIVWTLSRAVLALRTVHRWRSRSVEYRLPENLQVNAFRNVAVRIARDDAPVVPITFGIRRPIILLPPSAELWEDSRITAILWHELGHIRRGDNLSQLFGLFICALHWFNPILWFAARRMEAEAEMAADDFAIRRGLRASSYASELLAVASELHSSTWKFPVAHTAMVKAFTLEERLRAIIHPKDYRHSAPAAAYGKVAGAFAGMGVALILLTPCLASWLEPHTEAAAPTCLVEKQPINTRL